MKSRVADTAAPFVCTRLALSRRTFLRAAGIFLALPWLDSMTPVFADTYYWLALINPRDSAHQEAVGLAQSVTQPLVTTAWTLTEVGNAMCLPANRPTFVSLLPKRCRARLHAVPLPGRAQRTSRRIHSFQRCVPPRC